MALIPRFTTGPGINSLTGAKFLGTNVSASIDAGSVLSPSPYSLKLTQGETGAQAQTQNIFALSEVYGHFYLDYTAIPLAINEFLIILDGTNVSCSLRHLITAPNADKIGIYDGADNQIGVSSVAMGGAVWNLIEVHIKESSVYGSSGDGEIEVKLGGVEVFSSTTEDNIRGCSRIQCTNGTKDNNTDYYFAHMIWCDTTGAAMNSWIGDSRVTHHTVDGIGAYNDGTQLADNGSPNVAVTFTGTTLTDSREAWTPNEWIGAVARSAPGTWLDITSNDETTLTGSGGWVGAQPDDGSGWEIYSGDSDNWENVDENPPDDATTKNILQRDNEKETYTVITPTYNATPRCASVEMWCSNNTAGATILARYGAADYDGTEWVTWSGTYCWGGELIFYEEPGNGTPFTNAMIGNLEVGLKCPADVNEATAEKIFVSGAWVCVVYDQATYVAPPSGFIPQVMIF